MRSAQLRRFLLIVSVTILYTSIKAIQLWPSEPFAAVALTVLLFFTMLTGMFVYRGKPWVYDEFWFRILSWTGSLAMGLWATFIIISLPIDIVHFVLWLLGLATGIETFSASLYTGIYFFISALSLVLASFGFLQVWRGPSVVPVSVDIQNLPAALAGLKIAQISDLHVGTTIRRGYVEEVVRRTNATNPDLIFFTGDIADAHADSIVEHLKPLAGLKARYGSYYVTGNHEYYWNPQALIDQVKALGFKFLQNENVVLKIGGSKLLIAGVTDPAGEYLLRGHKPDTAMASETGEIPQLKILLAHRPGVCFEAEVLGFDMQFSGHTHSGQFFPFSLFIGLAHKYSRGLYRHLKMWVYVNPGTGYWGPANRLGVAPEISLITIRCLTST